jgi:hypothetical protein
MLSLSYNDITRYIANYNDISCFVKEFILTSTHHSMKLLGKSLTGGKALQNGVNHLLGKSLGFGSAPTLNQRGRGRTVCATSSQSQHKQDLLSTPLH